MQNSAKISQKGQVVIPIKLRKLLGFEEGDELLFREKNNQLIVEKVAVPTEKEWLELLKGIPVERVKFDEKGNYDAAGSPFFDEWLKEDDL